MIQNLNFNKYYKLFNIISVVLVILSIISILFKGLNYGVDFKGGTLIELRINDNQTTISNLRSAFNNMNLGDVAIKNFGNDNDYLIKFVKKDRDKNLIQNIKKDLQSSIGPVFEFRRVESVGPKVSAELLNKGLIAIAASLGAMLFYIWIRFEWQFSLGAIVALFHDVIITLGVFSLFSLEINLSIVAAVLTIVGYSMNDTVVIFDRVRDNLKKYIDLHIFDLTNKSINQTLSRTILTSMTTLLALLSIFFLGDKVGIYRWLAIVIGFIGVVMIMRPDTDLFSIYSIFPILVALLFSIAMIVLRFIPDSYSTSKIQFII